MELPAAARIVEREATIFSRLWKGSVFSYFALPTLFLAAMGIGLGGLIDERPGDVGGLQYLEFVTPGLLVAASMQLTAGDSLWPVLSGVKWTRQYHGMAATPIRPFDIYVGVVSWTAARSALSATAFLLVATLLGGVVSPWGVLALPAAVLCAAAFAAPLAAFSLTQDGDQGFIVVFRLGVMPLFLFSGTFFPVENLPTWLERVAWLSPLWHAAELARAATTGTGDPLDSAGHVVFLVTCIALGAVWGRRTFTRRLTP